MKSNMLKLPEIVTGHRYILTARHGLPETVHVFDERSRNAIEAAWYSGRPLLVRGDPGTGKSQLARAVSEAVGWQFIFEVISAHTEIQDLWYRFDAVSRLGQAQILSAIIPRERTRQRSLPRELAPQKFLSPGVLWWAYDWKTARAQYNKSHFQHYHPDSECDPDILPNGIVLLIDEIDKADANLPNSLLETLDLGRFRIPWINATVGCGRNDEKELRPLVVITTNEDRQLPPAFVRRCLVLNLELPEKKSELVEYLIRRGKEHFRKDADTPYFDEDIMHDAAIALHKDRLNARKLGVMPPGQAEYLDLLRVLFRLGLDKLEQKEKLQQIRHFALRKNKGMKQSDDAEGSHNEEKPK